MDEKITLITFTDPMMGLSYECEPIFRKLDKGALIQNLVDYNGFAKIFSDLSGGQIKPVPPQKNIDLLQDLLIKHPLISHIELREAFDFVNTAQIRNFIAPLLNKEIKIIGVPHGWFVEKILERV